MSVWRVPSRSHDKATPQVRVLRIECHHRGEPPQKAPPFAPRSQGLRVACDRESSTHAVTRRTVTNPEARSRPEQYLGIGDLLDLLVGDAKGVLVASTAALIGGDEHVGVGGRRVRTPPRTRRRNRRAHRFRRRLVCRRHALTISCLGSLSRQTAPGAWGRGLRAPPGRRRPKRSLSSTAGERAGRVETNQLVNQAVGTFIRGGGLPLPRCPTQRTRLPAIHARRARRPLHPRVPFARPSPGPSGSGRARR